MPSPAARDLGIPKDYDCGGMVIEAVFLDQAAILLLDGESIRLGAVASASGARYQGWGVDGLLIDFWDKGESATLSVAGKAFPDCRKRGDEAAGEPSLPEAVGTGEAPRSYRALGHEPSWSVEANSVDVQWRTPDVELPRVFTRLTWARRDDGSNLAATSADGAFALATTTAICRDGMSGMPYPDRVTVRVDDREFSGCGGDPLALLSANEWTVVTLAGGSLADTAPTLAFLPDGRASGFGGCNRWSAPTRLTGEGLSFGTAASTMMACPDAAMALERGFLDALASVTRHDFDDAGHLLLKAGDDTVVRATPSAAGAAPPGG